MSIIQKTTRLPLVRFAGVGALSTAIDIVIYNLFLWIGVGVYLAGAVGFLAGFANGYLLNSRFVFDGGSKGRMVKYLVVSVGGLIITELLLDLFHVRLGWGVNEAKLVAVVVVFVWNYTLSKIWAFK